MRRSATALVVIAAFVLGCVTQRAFAAQPKMEEALTHLRYALAALKAATHDKGGHRVKAIEHTEQAIEQVNQGIAFDAKH
jgi:hypothetical protein